VLRAEDGEPLDDEPAPVYVNGAEELPAQELPAEDLPAQELPAEDRTEAFPAEETAAEPVVVDAPRPLDPVRVHYIWEGALAVLLLGLVAVAFVRFPEARSVDFFSGLLTAAVVPTVLAMAFSLSLRGAVPNLAVVPLCALGAATYAATVGPQGTGTGVLRALGVTALAGLLVGALVVGLRIPAWAASGAVGLLVAGFAIAIAPATFQVVAAPALWGTGSALFAAVAAVSIAAGLLCLVPAVRRTLGAYRGQATAPTRSVLACVVAVCVLVLSSAVAGAAGLLLVFTTRTASGGLAPELWLALAAVVAGGASVYGRRVGVAGTVLGVLLLITVYRLWLLWHGVALGVVGVPGVLAVAGIAATVGLLATPLVEWAGRRAEVVDSP
jgi:ribose/xylose/arabinose/galactoside ABC-type transport system permease subunit